MKVLARVPAEAIVFLVAFAIRAAWVAGEHGAAIRESDDARAYQDLAINLAEHHQYVTAVDPPFRLDVPYAKRPPLTPMLLAVTYSIFGSRPMAGQLVLACLSSIAVAVLYRVGSGLFGPQVAVIAALVAAGYPFFVFLSAIPLTENVAILLYTLLAAVLIKSREGFRLRDAAFTGLVVAFAALNRPQILGLIPFLSLLVLETVYPWRVRLQWLGLAIGVALLVLMPWTIRNRMVMGGWFPVSLQGGGVLYEGNNPYTQTAIDKLRAGARGWYNDPQYGAGLSGQGPVEEDRRALQLAIDFMRSHPGKTIGYSLQKIGIFFSAYQHPVAKLSWYPIFAFSLLGFLWTRRQWRRLLPIYVLIFQTILTAAIYTSMPRFRAPVEPFFLLMAAFGGYRLWQVIVGERPTHHAHQQES